MCVCVCFIHVALYLICYKIYMAKVIRISTIMSSRLKWVSSRSSHLLRAPGLAVLRCKAQSNKEHV